MNLILGISIAVGIFGFLGYSYEVLAGRVTRFTRWEDLTAFQWIYTIFQMQTPLVLFIALLLKVYV